MGCNILCTSKTSKNNSELGNYGIIILNIVQLITNMKLTNKEKDEITWRVVDSLYEKLANELEYELEDHNDFTETNDEFMDLFNEMTIKIVKYMRSELFQPMTNQEVIEDLKQ